jgi:hypothetical protein
MCHYFGSDAKGHIVDRYLRTLLLLFIVFALPAWADDGFSELGAGGLVFAKSDAVSMDKEVLEIAPDRITASYEFKNNSAKDVSALVAFPLPPIKCGGLDRSQYPDQFQTAVDGAPVKIQMETKAVVRDEREDLLGTRKPGQDVTALLEQHQIPLDCRLLGPKDPQDDPLQQRFNKAYNDAAALGLALPEQPPSDPYEVYYQSQLKYYWMQVFPAGKTLHISHSYRPAYGASVIELPSDYSGYQRNVLQYRQAYASDPKLAPYSQAAADPASREFIIVDFILKSANSWDGPIKDFTLVVKKIPAFVVTSLDGDVQFEAGDLIVHKKDFAPNEDLQVYFVGPTKTMSVLVHTH